MAIRTVDPPSCDAAFGWMDNSASQGPCTVAAWLIELCEDPSSTVPAALVPLTGTTVYSTPNGTSATACSCSWAVYNTIEACTVCQNRTAQQWSEWTSNCEVEGLTSTTTYWPSGFSFSNDTKLPRWSILNPQSWEGQTFNPGQAQQIDDQNLPDVTDASAEQPTLSAGSGSRSSPAGAIAGGVVAGVLGLAALGLLAWYILYHRPRLSRARWTRRRRHVDLDDADPPGGPGSGNPLAAQVFAGYPVAVSGAMQSSVPVPGTMRVYPAPPPPQRTSRDSVPTVAEQLDEKRRLRAERLNRYSNSNSNTNAPLPGVGSSSTLHLTGSSTVAVSSDSPAQSFLTSLGVAPAPAPAPAQGQGQGDARRASIAKVPMWARRRVVMNAGSSAPSDAGTSDAGTPTLLAPRDVVPDDDARAGLPNAGSGDLGALVPGARLPSARDREKPPPIYSSRDA